MVYHLGRTAIERECPDKSHRADSLRPIWLGLVIEVVKQGNSLSLADPLISRRGEGIVEERFGEASLHQKRQERPQGHILRKVNFQILGGIVAQSQFHGKRRRLPVLGVVFLSEIGINILHTEKLS